MSLILAAQGAGKSVIAKWFPHFVDDGDDIITRTIGWPPGRWFETMTASELRSFHVRSHDAITNHVLAAEHKFVVWNTRVGRPDTRDVDDLSFRRLRALGRIAVGWVGEAKLQAHLANSMQQRIERNQSYDLKSAIAQEVTLLQWAQELKVGITTMEEVIWVLANAGTHQDLRLDRLKKG